MNKLNKNGFSKLEALIVMIIAGASLLLGVSIISRAVNKKNVENFKKEANTLINLAKNSYVGFEKTDKKNAFHPSTDGTSTGMCITVKGLRENDLSNKALENWDGYIVVEKLSNGDIKSTAWLTNKKYTLNGFEQKKLEELTLSEDGITKYNNESFSSSVKDSFTGTSGNKGGTGSSESQNIKKYQGTCINEKLE